MVVAFAVVLSAASPSGAEEKYAGIVFDANSGRTLYADNADARRYPASLTKMMTLYVLFGELEAKRLTLDSRLSVSANAASQAPSKIGVKPGTSIRVEDAILALTTKSANDVAVVIAENVGGSVSGFADRMNRTARQLGMNSSTFRNPHGLPNAEQKTTARDLVKLGAALQNDYPQYYKFFSARSFTYRGTRYRNHNRLLGSVAGVDGIKTGYTRASGFNLVSNVNRDGKHIIAVVMGGRTSASRDAHMRDLISRYLPAAKRGGRNGDIVIADAVSKDSQPEAVSPPRLPQPRQEVAEVVAPDTRKPQPRPDVDDSSTLAYAGAGRPVDVVAAAMAQAAEQERRAAAKPVAAAPAALPADPISQRIATATSVAELAAFKPAAGRPDPIARLTTIARIRAAQDGASPPVAQPRNVEMIAAASHTGAAPRVEKAGWHVQIGAVPTEDGARDLLQNARDTMGASLASVEPLTQTVTRNGTTLYRARFAGLADKDAARALCAKLENKSIDCLAVPN